jgi:hypothetical protein
LVVARSGRRIRPPHRVLATGIYVGDRRASARG